MILFILICLTMPILLVRKDKDVDVITKIGMEVKSEDNKYDYKDYNTIKLIHTASNEIEEMYLDEYLYGVVSAEMPASYDIEAIKAQAVVARTYTIYNIKNGSKHDEADVCDSSTCCQAYITKENRLEKWKAEERENNWNKIVEAVDSTSGEIITYNGEPINAFFHANSGGETEIASNVWGGKDLPYLQTVATSGEDGYTQYSSSVTLSKEELIEKIKQNYPEVSIDYESENPIQIMEFTDSGRVKTVRFGNIELSGVEARKILGLKSTKFDVIIGENITFNVVGYGHGVGMSQTGADSMAKSGSKYSEIIKHFYMGVEIQKI